LLDAVGWLVGATDWSTAGILALIVLADGLRRAPPDAVLVRQIGGGPWTVVPRGSRRPRLTLASWGAPLVTALLLPATGGGVPDPAWRVRFDRLRRRLLPIRVLGGAALLLLVAGIPVGTAAAGGAGFLAAVGAVVAVSLLTAAAAFALVRRDGGESRGVLGWAVHLLSPFTAPRAAELVLERWCAGQSQLALLRVLLPSPAFDSWIRPRAFDRLRAGAGGDPELDVLLDPDAMRALVARPPTTLSGGESYCPRCEGIYRGAVDACSDCGVALAAATRPS
jgi:hypothetical protein